MISVKNLQKIYDKALSPAVNDVSFDIEKGEIVGLLGPNGAGKTTIMRMLTCFMNPSSGDIMIDGKSTVEDPIGIKKLIGYLPENTPLYDDMTVYDYLVFTAEIRLIEKSGIADAVSRMIKLTSLGDVVTKKISRLSKGYKKRVGLASVMIHDPEILILDEPTAGLDPNQIITFRKMLRRLSQKKTIILSTHVLSEIEAICERVIIIKNGSIVANDNIQNLIKKYENEMMADFTVEADNLLDVELELAKISSAWKLEFVKKETKNIFRFRALVSKDSSFENELRSTADAKGWKVMSVEKNNANLEEIFLKLAGEEE